MSIKKKIMYDLFVYVQYNKFFYNNNLMFYYVLIVIFQEIFENF